MCPLEQKLSEIKDEETVRLFSELQLVTGVNPAHFSTLMVFHFLQQCLYPNGGSAKHVKISKSCIASVDDFDSFLLLKKVGKVGDALHQLLRGFTNRRRESLDDYARTAVYMFLNRVIVPAKKKNIRRYFL